MAKLYYQTDNVILFAGTMQSAIDDFITSNSVDSIVCDPPYELNFMGKGWDNSGVAFQKETWERCYKALKPGGYLLAFGGTRTYHRIACAIEDAGFEIRDCIMWLYGSGFPKSMNLGKSIESKLTMGSANTQEFKNLKGTKVESGNWGMASMVYEQGARPSDYTADNHLRTDKVEYQTELGKKYDGWGTCLKPAYEPIIVARKPLDGSCTDNVIKWGVGGLNIDECKVGDELISGGTMPDISKSEGHKLSFGQNLDSLPRLQYEEHFGRFPANVITDGSDEVAAGFPDTKSGGKITYGSVRKKQPDNIYQLGFTQKDVNNGQNAPDNYGDDGSAMRYFYCAKASKKDRDEGLDMLENQTFHRMRPDANPEKLTGLNTDGKFAPVLRKNIHPTVKPIELMQYLIRLVTPKGGVVMDCFMGSGSTGKAAMFENRERNADYKFIGIEMTEEYLPICQARIEYAINKYEYDWIKEQKEVEEKTGQLSLF